MKKSAKKLQLNKENVRQLSPTQAKQVFGGMGIYDSLLGCPYSELGACPIGLGAPRLAPSAPDSAPEN